MHALAAVLGTSTAAVERGVSAREFAHWVRWMEDEQVGPEWDRLRYAQLLAAIYTGPSQRVGGGAFKAADFMPQRARSAAQDARTPEEIAAQLAGGFGALDWAGVKGVRVG